MNVMCVSRVCVSMFVVCMLVCFMIYSLNYVPSFAPIPRKRLKEQLTYLVPSSVHFMDEIFMNEVVKNAVTHLVSIGNECCYCVCYHVIGIIKMCTFPQEISTRNQSYNVITLARQ